MASISSDPCFEHLNPLPYSVGQLMEEELARHLQSLGYAVWQN